MANMTDYLERQLINGVLGGVTFNAPVKVYLALFTADPTDAGSLEGEVSTAGGTLYARQEAAFNALVDETDGQTENSAQVSFPEAGASWGTVTHVGIMDALTDGNMLFHGALTTPRVVDAGVQLIFKTGQLTVTLA